MNQPLCRLRRKEVIPLKKGVFITLITVIVLLSGLVVEASTKDRTPGEKLSILSEGQPSNELGDTVQEDVIRISDPKAIQLFQLNQDLHFEPPFPGAKIKEIVIKRSIPLNKSPLTIQSTDIRNVTFGGSICGSELIRRSSASGPGTLHMSVTNTVPNSYTASVSVSAGVVSAGVGFNVTATESITESYDLTIPAGKIGVIEAHPWKDLYDFEVWEDPWYWWGYKTGDGTAYRVTGICFAAWTN